MEKREKVLIFNVNWLGDVLFSTAAIKAIRQFYPKAYIGCVAVPRVREILENNPNLDEIIIYDESGSHKGLFGKLKLISKLKKHKFDKVFLLHRSFTRALVCFLAGIPKRIGYYTKKRGFLLTKKVYLADINSMHRVDYFLNLLEAVGIKAKDRYYEFFIPQKDKVYVESLLYKSGIKKDDFLILLHPGGNWEPKRWPKENFATLAKNLIRDFKAKVIISGTDKDLDLANQISKLTGEDLIILCGKTTIKQLGALIEEVDLVVSADSGPLHIAAAVGTDIIALFGPTSPNITGPITKGRCIIIHKDIGCKIPCYNLECSDNRCMKLITVEDVLDAIRQFRN